MLDHPEWAPSVVDLGKRSVHGRSSRCFEVQSPKDRDPELYSYRTELCLDRASHLYTSLRSWDVEDGALRLVEDYSYGDIVLNAGLTDVDVSPDNRQYHL